MNPERQEHHWLERASNSAMAVPGRPESPLAFDTRSADAAVCLGLPSVSVNATVRT